MSAEDLEAQGVSLVAVVSGYDVVAAQTVHARKSYDHFTIRFGHRYVDVLGVSNVDGSGSTSPGSMTRSRASSSVSTRGRQHYLSKAGCAC